MEEKKRKGAEKEKEKKEGKGEGEKKGQKANQERRPSAHPPALRGRGARRGRRHSAQAQRPRPASAYHAGRLEDAARGARELPVHLHLLHGGAARRRAVPEGAPVGGRRARAPRSSTPPRAGLAVLPGRGEVCVCGGIR